MITIPLRHRAPKLGASLVLTALAGMAANAAAADGDSMYSLSGFGTVGVAKSTVKTGDYVANTFQLHGAGASNSMSATVDSKLAVQADARFSDSLSAVIQVVAASRPDNSFSPEIEWANVKYAVTKDLSIRLGRTALPVFMVSDTRLVGFANPWIRPPIETYSLYSLTNSDGVDLSYRMKFGELNSTTQVWRGNTKVDTVNANNVSHDLKGKITGVGNTFEYGFWTAKIGFNSTDFTLTPAPNYTLKFKSRVLNVGAIYDPGTWFVQGELTRTSLDNLQRVNLAGYLTAGVRYDRLTPYVSYSAFTPHDDQYKLALRKQHSLAAGVRWDFRKNMDLKLQFEQVSLAKGSTGLYTNVKPGLAGSTGNVLSAAIDFVF